MFEASEAIQVSFETDILNIPTAARLTAPGGQPRRGAIARVGGSVSRRRSARAPSVALDASSPTAERIRALQDLVSSSAALIERLRQDLAQTRDDAARDALTGLANRRGFDAALRLVSEQPADMCLLILDIDHFKRFNDTHGHPLGDAVLRMVARVISDEIRTCDIAARHGGEEFAVILPGASLTVGSAIAEEIRRVLEHRGIHDRGTGKQFTSVTCSVGVARYRSGEPVEALVERCDQALYRAKHGGRNRVETEASPPR